MSEVIKMGKSIEISKKYGVNPTIPVCFFCGEQKNEIALLGHIGDRRKGEDIEAPRYAVLDYEPCDCCKDKFNQGVLFIEVTSRQPEDRRPAISKDDRGVFVYPTGRHVVVKREALNVDGDKYVISEQDFNQMFGEALNK